MDLCFNKIVRTACGGFLLMLTGAISGARWAGFPSTARRYCTRSRILKVAIVPWNSDCKVAKRSSIFCSRREAMTSRLRNALTSPPSTWLEALIVLYRRARAYSAVIKVPRLWAQATTFEFNPDDVGFVPAHGSRDARYATIARRSCSSRFATAWAINGLHSPARAPC